MKVLLITACILVLSCTKQTDYSYLNTDRRQPLDKYQHWIDHYSKDTTIMGVRTLWAQWYEPRNSTASHETMKDQIFLNCDTDSLDHWYYKVNDTNLFKTGLIGNRKLQPSRVDTNRTNYTK